MDAGSRPRVVVIDDHPVIAAGLAQMAPGVEVVASHATVEAFLVTEFHGVDVVLLDLQLDASPTSDGTVGLMGTAAVRAILDADRGPVVIYTSIAEEMILAACLAAGALGAVTKTAPASTVVEVVRMAARGTLWVDPSIAGALSRYAQRRHAGALSPQQANALQYRGQGLKQQAIAERIGVSDPEVVYRYLRSAVEKLADAEGDDDDTRHPGASIDDLARRTGLAAGLVQWKDLQTKRLARSRRHP